MATIRCDIVSAEEEIFHGEASLVVATGEAMIAAVRSHFAAIFASRPVGITLQIDEGQPVFDAKHSNLHPLFDGR